MAAVCPSFPPKFWRKKREARLGGAAQMAEPYAYAKLATRGDVLPPFYITDQHVKEKDASGVPTKIEIVLGRS